MHRMSEAGEQSRADCIARYVEALSCRKIVQKSPLASGKVLVEMESVQCSPGKMGFDVGIMLNG
jgi:hypothetical protein